MCAAQDNFIRPAIGQKRFLMMTMMIIKVDGNVLKKTMINDYL